jgi:hypothetical protein
MWDQVFTPPYLSNPVSPFHGEPLHLVIVTADHGELFGENRAFGHGQELYRPVAQVPLLIIARGLVPSGRTIARPVSVRDLPATVVDLLGLGHQSPFPGRSLARHWAAESTRADEPEDLLLTESADEVGRLPPRLEIVAVCSLPGQALHP